MSGKLRRNLSTPEMKRWWQSVDDAARRSREVDELLNRHRTELEARHLESGVEKAEVIDTHN